MIFKKVCEYAHILCDFAHTTQGNNIYLCPIMNKEGKILIVDDNEDVLFALHLLLEPHVEKVKVTTYTVTVYLLAKEGYRNTEITKPLPSIPRSTLSGPPTRRSPWRPPSAHPWRAAGASAA